mmetsp:Transcript_12589/g.28502  ORF Transcript_12589/g.28502 Transcript_12589/m.28502 type:complete len:424 (-) Transcript_12589:139-1410(-)
MAWTHTKYLCWRVAGSLLAGILLAGLGAWYDAKMADEDKGVFPPFNCKSDLKITGLARMASKGLAIDSSTAGCSDKIPQKWPNTNEPVKALRIFRANEDGWANPEILRFRNTIANYAIRANAKVLVGTQITCDETADDEDWKHVRELLKVLGPKHVMGLAVGNEIDLLWQKAGVDSGCLTRMWGNPWVPGSGYLLKKLQNRIAEARTLLGTQEIYVTSVFTASILWSAGAMPFQDDYHAKINTLIKKLHDGGETRWAYTMNFYPYFDPTLTMDADNVHCTKALEVAKCFNLASCKGTINLLEARKRMKMFTQKYGQAATSPFWVGEVGWSAPQASTLHTTMENCVDFSSYQTLYQYYSNFLKWDLSVPGAAPPDMVFYFTARDSSNFGNVEHFGLMESCASSTCKLRSAVGAFPNESLTELAV